MMRMDTSERRISRRVAARHPAVLREPGGAVLMCARVCNVSDRGVFIVARVLQDTVFPVEVVLETETTGKDGSRLPRVYRCRVVRCRRQGSLLGVGLEFLENITASANEANEMRMRAK